MPQTSQSHPLLLLATHYKQQPLSLSLELLFCIYRSHSHAAMPQTSQTHSSKPQLLPAKHHLPQQSKIWPPPSGLALGIMRLGAVQKNEAFYLKKYIYIYWKITLQTVSAKKLLIKLLYSIFSNKSCSIDNMANLFNHSCDIVDCK